MPVCIKQKLGCRLLASLLSLLVLSATGFGQSRPTFTINGVAAVNGSTLRFCQGSRVSFVNTTTFYNTFFWRFDNGNPATVGEAPFVSVRFDSLGSAKAVLIRVSSDGRVDSSWVFLEISNVFPVAAFDFSPKTLECGSSEFRFTDASTGTGLSYNWNFGDTRSSTQKDPVHRFTNALGATGNTTYTITQIVTNNGGCRDTATTQVTVKNIPDIRLGTADPLVVFGLFNGRETFRYCSNIPAYLFQFRNQSSTLSAITGYTIQWGDGTPDSSFANWPADAIIRHVFPRGSTRMTITANGSNGCSNTKVFDVFVGGNPAGGFASPGNTEICAPDSLFFIISGTANNPPGTIYRVDINDGTPSKIFNHPAPDTVGHWFEESSCGVVSSNGTQAFSNSFFALLNIENPCGTTSVNVIPIYVSGNPTPAIGVSPSSNICVNVPAQVRNTGNYGGLITATGGGNSTCENRGILVWELSPAVGYTITNGRLGNRNNRPVQGNEWTGGTETFNITFSTPGIYRLWQYMYNERCGIDSIGIDICVRMPPTAGFSMNKRSGCAPDTVSFTNTSPKGPCLGEQYFWTVTYDDPAGCGGTPDFIFVHGTNSRSENPQIAFRRAGRYIIEQRVNTVASGCDPVFFRDTFYIKEKPLVTLDAPSRICAANAINPLATVNSCYDTDGEIYAWEFAGGSPATAGGPVPGAVFYASSGNYIIRLRVTNDCGITEATTQLEVGGRPVANSGADINICSNAAAPLGMTAVPGIAYSWAPALGLSAVNIANPAVNYRFAGPAPDTTIAYVLTASAGANCATNDTVQVTIRQGPQVQAVPAFSTLCAGGSVVLTASGADSYQWSPAAGLSETQTATVLASPQVTTLYTVTGTLANNCSAAAQVNVTVIGRPAVHAGPDTLVCNNAPNIVLQGLPAGGTWSGSAFVSGTGVFNPGAAGNGTFKLYYAFTAAGCDGIDSMVVRVQDPPPAAAGADVWLCADGGVYRLNGQPAGGTWSGSALVSRDGVFTASVPGVYNLVYSNGSGSCIGRDTVVVTVVNTVSNNIITAGQGLCAGVQPAPLTGSNATAGGLTLTYQWQSSTDSLNWININGASDKDLSIPVPVQTIFYRRLASTQVCSTGSPSNVVKIFIHPNALADIKPAPLVACPPFTINSQVINLSTYPDRNSVYRWFAGNTLIGTGTVFPGYTISTPDDSVRITLVAISRFGCVDDTATVWFKTLSNPVPSFSLSDTVGCGPLNIRVVNTTPQAARFQFRWDFGNGDTSTLVQPGTVRFDVNPNRGDTVYRVRLLASGGCDIYEAMIPVNVRTRPRTIFTPDRAAGCSPFTVTFNNNSAGSNAVFSWDFGDGTPLQAGSTAPVAHTYFTNRIDTFRVRLFGTNDCGTDTGRFNLVVNPNLIRLDFAVNGDELNGCSPHRVTFYNNTTGANIFRWNFGDGSAALTTNRGFDTVTHVFADTGTFVVQLFASNGCSDTLATETIRIAAGPKVAFAVQPAVVCLGAPFTLVNTSEDGLAWNWDFGDGTSSTLRNPVKLYDRAGVYRIVLRGTRQFAQGFGCADSAVATLTVNAPAGNWNYRGGYYCSGEPAVFTVNNTNADRFRYYFGNGDSLITGDSQVRYTYPAPGSFLPQVVLERAGCSLRLSGPDSLRADNIRAGFAAEAFPVCGETAFRFRDTSAAYFGLQQWNWLFGDGTSANTANAVKIFSLPGDYAITLRVTGISGCSDTIRRVLAVPVNQFPVLDIAGDSTACAGQPATFTALDATGGTAVYDWVIQAGGTSSGNTTTVMWQQPGTYRIQLIGRTAFGCADTVVRFIRVHPTPVLHAGVDVTICQGQRTTLRATANAPVVWSPLEGLSCTDCLTPIANPALTTRYVATATNQQGCIARDTVLVTVAQPFAISVSGADSICASNNESVQLLATNAIRYQWTPAAGLSAANISNPVARPATTTTYRVVGFDGDNCFSDTATITIGVGFNPTVTLPPGRLVVAGTQVPLAPVISGDPVARYTWTPAATLSCSNCATPVATVNTNTSYRLVIETIYGCTASDTISFVVQCQADQVYIPNAFSPDGDGVNDIMMVRGKGVAQVKSFRIFNRYGQVVFERQNFTANDPAAGWDGRVNGVPASPDVYVYTAEVICTAGAVYTYKGNLTLFR